MSVLVPVYVLLMLVFGPMVFLLVTMGLASLYFVARRILFGDNGGATTNATLPELMERVDTLSR